MYIVFDVKTACTLHMSRIRDNAKPKYYIKPKILKWMLFYPSLNSLSRFTVRSVKSGYIISAAIVIFTTVHTTQTELLNHDKSTMVS